MVCFLKAWPDEESGLTGPVSYRTCAGGPVDAPVNAPKPGNHVSNIVTAGDRSISIAGRRIGPGEPPFIVAEISGNHNGSLERALELIEAASEAGADAVKLQTYTADTMTIDSELPDFRIDSGLWAGRTLYALYEEASTPWEWHPKLFERGAELGLPIFSSPFDETAVAFLESLEAPAYKIASFEAVDVALIERVARSGKPVIISTGMATLDEIDEAVKAARRGGCVELLLLHCVSGYPTPAAESNLRTIPDLAARFDVSVGLSDHTLGIAVPIAAVAAGASFIEKHLTIRRADGGPDSEFSLEPDELALVVTGCRTAWEALGHAGYERQPSEQANTVFRRSLYVVADVAMGEPLTRSNVRAIRPGYGLAPKLLIEIIGRRAARDIRRGTALTWDLVE
jgi:N-acetylneuraminate synthase